MRKDENINREIWRDQIELDYGHLSDETSEAGQVCPACKGGAHKEKSLSVSRRGGVLLWNCHRGSCGYHGASGYVGGSKGQTLPERESRTRASSIKITPLDQATVKILAAKYGVTRDALDLAELGWSGDGAGYYERRICFPIFGPSAEKRGVNLRSYQGAVPKSIIEMYSSDDPILCWYKFRRASDTLVIVEDQMSALKLTPYVHSVALLGVNLSEAKVDEIKLQKYKRVVLSLDNDAIPIAIKLVLKWRDRLPGLRILGIARDIKDMNQEELKEYVRRVTE